MRIVNFKGDSISKTKKEEFDKLEYETVVAPFRYEIAFQAYYRLAEWEDGFNKLLYDQTLLSIRVIEGK